VKSVKGDKFSVTLETPVYQPQVCKPEVSLNAGTEQLLKSARHSNLEAKNLQNECRVGKNLIDRYPTIFNPDPIAFFVAAALVVALFAGLSTYYFYHARALELYREELTLSSNRLNTLLASIDDNVTATAAADTSALAENDIAELKLSAVVSSKTDSPVDQSVDNTSFAATKLSGEEFNRAEDITDSMKANAPVSEVDELRLLVNKQAQQIEFIAAENHELRLLMQFGVGASTVLDNTNLVLNTYKPSADDPSANVLVEESAVARIEPTVEVLSERRILQQPAVDGLLSDTLSVSGKARQLKSLLERANSFHEDGNYVQSAEHYQQALTLDPSSRDANLGVAGMAVINGRQDHAIDIYRQLLTVKPNDPVVVAALLQLATDTNGIDQEVLSHIDQLPSTSAAVYAAVAIYYSAKRRWSEAIPFYVKSDAVMPSADVLYNLAVCLEHLGRHKEAVLRYSQALDTAGSFGFDRELVKLRLLTLSGG